MEDQLLTKTESSSVPLRSSKEKKMKLNRMQKMAMLIILLSVGTMFAGCKNEDNNERGLNTALLYLVNDQTTPDADQIVCLTAYNLANSCVSGSLQLFNPGTGCSKATIGAVDATKGTTSEQMAALRECVRAAVNDPIQPCNMPQFSYPTAGQVVTNYIKAKCSVAEYTIAPATVKTKQDITSLLKY
jgi:hypothetical protein